MGNAFSCFSKGRSTSSEARATSTVVFDPTGQQAARVNLPPSDNRFRDHKHGTVEAQWAHCYVYCTNPTSQGADREYYVQSTMDARSGWEYINEVSMALWEPRDSTTMELFIGPIPNITNG